MTRYIRLMPLEWSRSGRIGLRLEAYGCPHSQCSTPLTLSHSVTLAWVSQGTAKRLVTSVQGCFFPPLVATMTQNKSAETQSC